MTALSAAGLDQGTCLQLIRQDPRTTSEKNCALVDALYERRMQDALDIMRTNGFPINPNSVRRWNCPKQCFLNGGRDFHDIMETFDPALSLAIKAQKQWDSKGNICGEGVGDEEVVPVVKELLYLRADANATNVDVHTCGSWPCTRTTKSPLLLAIETGSVASVQLLLEARADANIGKVNHQFRDEVMTCEESAQRMSNLDMLELLRTHAAKQSE